MERRLPIKVYLELDLHPERRAKRTKIDPKTKYTSIEKVIEKVIKAWGNSNQNSKETTNLLKGVNE
jgi:adenine C2-methylase RlmN of 23S rRNA A2503 and tRNA A37